ncbi:MAG: hypothetical protein JSR36_00495 [Proteobacteria bacterium]|nr:hypothetical protein [Pseudomonadota bacterium]
MSMTQLVLGCALGFLIAEGILWAFRHLLRRRAPAARAARTESIPSSYIRAFIQYAAPVGASVAFVALGAWTVQDYLSAKSARAAAEQPEAPLAAEPAPDAASESIAAAPAGADEEAEPRQPDPYKDAEFRVVRHAHPGEPLRDRLVQRAEQKAGAQLLAELRAHAQRSQYDCEAVEHAQRYLKAGLDVWGFSMWQSKHFPVEKYPGATLPQCQELERTVDPSLINLKSAVARSSPGSAP